MTDRISSLRSRAPDSLVKLGRTGKVLLSKWLAGGRLRHLGEYFGCDKFSGAHSYDEAYERFFRPLRSKPINILEIGIGGYDNPRAGGASLRVWKAYFSRAKIYAVDLADGKLHEQRRIKTFQGDQGDVEFLKSVAEQIGPLDIVIDDGSHLNKHVILGFRTLFPYISPQGIYVAEDIQTSYWPGMGGDTQNKNNPETSMGFFKSLTDGLNYAEYELETYSPTDYDRGIKSVHFYHNLVIVQKGDNTEPSNILGKRW